MEEEMRKIEEEFAFQEKWIKIFKRGKFFFQNIPELLILKIITKGKRPEVVKKKRNQDIQKLRKIIRSKYYFFLCDTCYENLMPLLEDLYSKEAYHFRRECWNVGVLRINEFPINISLINHLQPIAIEILMNQNGPLSENFYIPARTKDFFVEYDSLNDSDFYKEVKRFGSLPLKIKFRRDGHLELDKLFSILKGITQERHLHHPLQFLTYKKESRSNYEIFKFWPTDSFFPSSESRVFYFIIVAKSDVGVSVIYLYKIAWHGSEQSYTLQIMGIKSFDEWEEFTKRETSDVHYNLETGLTYKKIKEELAGVLEDFNAQVASEFFEGGKLIYPPLAPPEPAREFVEFLKEFEDFDIQPEKLAPHKPKWKKTEKLPDLPRKLPEIHSNNWLIEAKEIEPKRFPLLFSSTKWVNELIQNSASNFRIHGGSFWFSMNEIYKNSSYFKEALKSLEFYYFNCIEFEGFNYYDDFNNDINYFKEVLQWVRERKIFVKRISLGIGFPLIQELFESFARGPESFLVSEYTPLPEPIKFSPQLKEIKVNVNFCGEDQIERIKELIEGFGGIEKVVIWICLDDKDTNKTITHQLETLKSKKCRSNILIRSRNGPYPHTVNYDPQFDLSQISETVFIFRSMARGRGGVWNYFIRLEEAGTGAVGIAYFDDSLHVIEESERYIDIRCEYFPTMESFLDYFEREVGSKRRVRDWMQLREKDRTIEPREKDFKKFKKLTPFIQFNEQKEADDLKEVRRRFFS